MMTSNNYIDKNGKKALFTKKDMTKMALNEGALGMEFSWNYERQMHLAFCMMIDPYLEKIYKNDPVGYRLALTRHVEFFNITPQLAPFVGGIAVSMEEAIAKKEMEPESVSNIKTALMGPLSGIGDSIFLGCIRIIALGIGLSFALDGNILGPILYWLIYNIPAFGLRIFGAQKGYELGFSYLDKIQKSGLMNKLMEAAGVLSMIVIGAMSSGMVYTTLGLEIGSGESVQTLQELLDGIMPGIVALGVTWLYYWLLKKRVSPMVLIVCTVIIGIVGAYFGIFVS
ncbi:PTS system mannose/fructose/sorbose family transporter subunit IID [Miniphocaeibacter halophilus]|nr:PTS system mannose/fructose/sorbose family transporter subunit IID [Miniphocaeibacter halophilus]